jgi:hypothetical protein
MMHPLLIYIGMKKLFIISFFFLFMGATRAQNYFTKFYGRPGERQYIGYASTKSIEIAPKKYQVLYLVTNINTRIRYFNIATLNEFGDTTLVKSYAKPSVSFIYNVVVKKDFLYYSGDVFDSITQKQHFLLMKVNFLGDTLWTKKYDLHYNTGACGSIVATNDNGFILTGWTTPYDTTTGNTGLSKGQVIKVDSSGNLQWSKYYGSANTTDVIYSAVETPEKDLIFVGVKDIYYPRFEVDFQYYLFKTNSLGDLIWEKSYGNRNWLEGYQAIIKTKDNNYLLGGSVNYTPITNTDIPIQLTKINTNGDTLWERKYLRSGEDILTDMVETTDGSIVFTGWIYRNTPRFQAAGYLHKVNARGDSLWMRTIDSDTMYDDYINHINQTSDKGFILTGAGFPPGRRNAEAWIIKVDSLGCTYNGCAISTATHDYTEGSHVMTLFPNPASDVLNIDFKTTAFLKDARLLVVDVVGRVIKNVKLDDLTSQYSLDVQGIPNGIYFCTLLSNHKTIEIQKFTVIK